VAADSARWRLQNLGHRAAARARGAIAARGNPAAGRAQAGLSSRSAFVLEGKAHELADRLPDLVLEAMRITNTVTHGIHGRRRAGPGETFWQFRQFGDSDTAQQIDWRRSASSDHLFVREREWEAAHTVWLWSNLSSSMIFQSHLSTTTKRDRALVLMLAIGELLVRGGERIALLGLTKPTASRRATTRIIEAIASHAIASPAQTMPQTMTAGPAGQPQTASQSTSQTAFLSQPLPPKSRLSRYAGTILFSDFLEPIEQIEKRLRLLAADGVSGHLVQILDPAEETLPYDGRSEFHSMDGAHRWVADRAESLRQRYMQKMRSHRARLEDIARALGWSFLLHHSNRPASEALLTLTMRLQGEQGNYRWHGNEDGSGGGGDSSGGSSDDDAIARAGGRSPARPARGGGA